MVIIVNLNSEGGGCGRCPPFKSGINACGGGPSQGGTSFPASMACRVELPVLGTTVLPVSSYMKILTSHGNRQELWLPAAKSSI